MYKGPKRERGNVNVTIRMPKKLHRKLKVFAANKERSLSSVIEEAVERWFKEELEEVLDEHEPDYED